MLHSGDVRCVRASKGNRVHPNDSARSVHAEGIPRLSLGKRERDSGPPRGWVYFSREDKRDDFSI